MRIRRPHIWHHVCTEFFLMRPISIVFAASFLIVASTSPVFAGHRHDGHLASGRAEAAAPEIDGGAAASALLALDSGPEELNDHLTVDWSKYSW